MDIDVLLRCALNDLKQTSRGDTSSRVMPTVSMRSFKAQQAVANTNINIHMPSKNYPENKL